MPALREHDGLAVHRLPKDQTAFELDEAGLIRLAAAPIAKFAKPGEPNMPRIMEICAEHGIHFVTE